MTYALPPDLVIMLGVRASLSLLGLAVLLTGFWMMEKRWDDQGSSLFQQAVAKNAGSKESNDLEAHYVQAPDSVVNKGDDAIRMTTEDADEASAQPPVNSSELPANRGVVSREELEAALPVPTVMLVGFAIWNLSFLFHPEGGFYFSEWNIICIVSVSLIGYLLAHPMRTATLNRNLEKKKRVAITMILVAILLTVAGILDKQTDAKWYFCSFGALLCLASHHVIRRSRKMGVSWDLEGVPSSNIVCQSLGTLALLFGVFLFWIGTNAIREVDFNVPGTILYFPIYTNYKGVLAFVAAFVLIIPSLLALDLAFDEGSEPNGFSLDGRTFVEASKQVTAVTLEPFAGLVETPVFFLLGWTLLGLCAFMPFGEGFTIQKIFMCIIPIGIGGVYSLKLLPAYWKADQVEFKTWRNAYHLLMIFLSVATGVGGGAPLLMSMFGVFFILLGQHLDMLERKRGTWWLQERELNPHPTVFGIGQPIYLLGWMFLCLSMAIPV